MTENFEKKDYVVLADLAMQSERYEEMIGFVKKFADGSTELNKEERKYLATAYKQTVGNKRAELRVLSAIEQKEKSKEQAETQDYIKKFKREIEEELKRNCYDVIDLLSKKLIPNSMVPENKIFYLKMKADYYRYIAEFILEENLQEICDKAEEAYKEAEK